jgi:hypothetical protein
MELGWWQSSKFQRIGKENKMNATETKQLLDTIEAKLCERGKKGEYIFGDNCVAVKVVSDDGSIMFFDNALMVNKDQWHLIFTEHHGQHFFHEEEATVSVYKRLYNNQSGLLDDIIAENKL